MLDQLHQLISRKDRFRSCVASIVPPPPPPHREGGGGSLPNKVFSSKYHHRAELLPCDRAPHFAITAEGKKEKQKERKKHGQASLFQAMWASRTVLLLSWGNRRGPNNERSLWHVVLRGS